MLVLKCSTWSRNRWTVVTGPSTRSRHTYSAPSHARTIASSGRNGRRSSLIRFNARDILHRHAPADNPAGADADTLAGNAAAIVASCWLVTSAPTILTGGHLLRNSS